MSAPPAPPGDVLVVGDLMVDVVAVPSGPLQHGSDVASRIRTGGGGSAANTACWLAAAGASVRLAAMVGDDPAGHAALAELAAMGVAFAGGVLAGASTGTCVLLVDQHGERTMLPDRGANDRLDPALVETALQQRRPRWLHLSGYTLLGDGSRPAARAAVARAAHERVDLSVDASSAGPLAALGGTTFLELVEGARILFANDDELDALGGIAACLRRVQVVVAKHGPAGVSWHEPGRTAAAPAEPTTVVVDTVGAGDALDAGVIHAVLSGADPATALAAGARLAAQAVARQGARPPHHAG